MLLVTVIQVLEVLLSVLWWIIVIQWVLSLLVSFNVINTWSPLVRQIMAALTQMTEPLYRPIRRILPDFGGIDFSPAVVMLLIIILQRIILPNILASAVGASAGAM